MEAYLGIDVGSVTTKLAALDKHGAYYRALPADTG